MKDDRPVAGFRGGFLVWQNYPSVPCGKAVHILPPRQLECLVERRTRTSGNTRLMSFKPS